MSRLSRWSLRRRLVIGVALLVAAAFLLTGVTTLVSVRASALDRLDEQVVSGLDRSLGPDGPAVEDLGAPPGPGSESDQPPARVGSLHVVLRADGTAAATAYTDDTGTEVALTPEQVGILASAQLEHRTPTTVDLGGTIGSLRVAAEARDGTTVISGSSLQDVTATTTATAAILAAVMGGVLILVTLGLVLVITRALRPLRRVAATAQRVSDRPLARGVVELPDRVDPADTDPRTEVGQVGSALNAMLHHIEGALTARQDSEEKLRRFVADASHELRTPLTSIRGYAQLSQGEGAPMTPTQERSLTRISAEATRMSALVDDLLLLARLDAGQPLRRDPVELTHVLIEAVDDAHAADPHHRWLLEVEESLEVLGDEDRLRQVLVNLLGNARAHTPEGTTVTASLDLEGDEAVVRITDDGPGIDPELSARLFERFSRGDASRTRLADGAEGPAGADGAVSGGDTGGTGLGLSISEAIVLAHGGRIEVTSEPGRTTFTVRLPLLAGGLR